MDKTEKRIDELENKIKQYEDERKKIKDYIKRDTRWFDWDYARTYGELCTCEGAGSHRLEVMINPSNILKIIGDKDD